MSKIYDVAVVGGGFSGLVAAEKLSKALGGENIIVSERNDRVGKKIFATGNGRCNLTNVDISEKRYHSVMGGEIGFENYGERSLIEYFNSLGVNVAEEDGRIYPSSFQAGSVVDALRLSLSSLGTVVKTGVYIQKITKDGKVFKLKYSGGEITSERVILSCGGKVGKQYGTDGTSYALAEHFGHFATNLFPSLVQIKTDREWIKGLKGLKIKAKIKLLSCGKEITSSTGDVLFTDYGVSGNAVFNVSAYVHGLKSPELSLEFLPWQSEDDVFKFLCGKTKLGYIGTEDIFTGVINKLLGRLIVKRCNAQKFTEREAAALARELKDYRLKIEGTLGFDEAQVTHGGICLKDIDVTSMESKLEKGLYLVGEYVDVDGDCGGFNLQWAYTSASLAAADIKRRSKNDQD